MAILINSSNKLQIFFQIFIIVLILPSGKAWIEGFGQVFGQMGEQLSGFVDNLYNNVDSWADHIIEHAKGEECHYLCPYGKTLAENTSYIHVSTGCGPLGLQIKETDLPMKEMRECCDEHQMCYHKCSIDKNKCDEEFNQCLDKKCKESQTEEALLRGCRTATKLLMMSFLTFGCKSFKDSQKKACLCVGSEEL